MSGAKDYEKKVLPNFDPVLAPGIPKDGPFYIKPSKRTDSSYATFLEQLAGTDYQAVKQIAKDTAMEEIKSLVRKGEYEGAHPDTLRKGNGMLRNMVAASITDKPRNQDELEDYFLNLYEKDPERFGREHDSFSRVFELVKEGVDEAEVESIMMGGQAAQVSEKEVEKRYQKKLDAEKPNFFIRAIRSHPKATASVVIGSTVGLGAAIYVASPLIFGFFNSSNNNKPETPAPIISATDSDGDGLSDYDEINVYHTDPHNIDTDGDYIRDDLEVNVYHSNPLKIDSDDGGMDDFNETFTYPHYGMDPNNPEDDIEFINKLPNVVARHWEQERGIPDGGVPGTHERFVEISMRDPFIKYLAERAEIEWLDRGDGIFYVNKELIWESVPETNERSIDQPSYYFTHGRKGNCAVSSLVNHTILKAMGHKAIEVTGYRTDEPMAHGWVEAFINGKVYVVDGNILTPREGFYEERGQIITSSNYDSNWYENK